MIGRVAVRILAVVLPATVALALSTAAEPPEQDKSTPAAAVPERKTVTLQAERMPVSQALAELSKQTGIHVEDLRGRPDESITLNLNQTSFWPALDTLAAAAAARVNLYPTSGRIVLSNRGSGYRMPPISYDGRFRLSVKKITTSRDLEVKDEKGRGGATHLAVEIAWDPLLLPLYLETRPHSLRLVDDRNHVVTIPDEGSSLAPVAGVIALGIDLRLPALPRSATVIRSLEGELSMIGPSKMLDFTFPKKLDQLADTRPTDPERQLTQEGVTCRILDVKLLRERWTIQLALELPPGMKQLDSNQSWVVNNEITLESLDGKKQLTTREYALESATAKKAVLSYHFRDHGPSRRGKASDWRLRYRAPANLIEVPIKFAFKDIPLP